MTTKRFLAALLALCLVLTMLPAAVYAAQAQSDPMQCGEDVYATFEEDTGTLTIFGTGAMYDFSGQNETPWTELPIVKVVVENGVASIGSEAFYRVVTLTEVVLPESVTSIGDEAFFLCENLETINIPSKVTYIGEFAFHQCYKLNNVTIPDTLTRLEDYVFSGCEAMTAITVPSTVKEIGIYVLAGCSVLKNVVLEEGIPAVGDGMFTGCNALETLVVPASAEYVGYEAFYDTALKEITFLGDAPDFESDCFLECVATAKYPEDNATWTDEVLQNYRGTITWVPYQKEEDITGECGENLTWSMNKNTGVLTISGTGPMDNYDETEPSFRHAPWISAQLAVHITNVVIEEGVTTIGEYAFYGLDHIVSVQIPETVTEIGTGAFIRCESLIDITLPEGLTELGYRVFERCWSLESINIPDGIPAIRADTFDTCYMLSEVKISENCLIEHIGPDAFYSCPLKEFTFPDNLRQIGDYSFNCAMFTAITLPASVVDIRDGAFGGCSELKEIVFEGDAPDIGENAFMYVNATAIYPVDNSTWTEAVMQDYGGTITWTPSHTHSYTSVVTAPTCTEKGYTTYTCSCGNSYKDNYVDALGHAYGEPEFIGRDEGHSYTCTRCGTMKTESCTFDNGTVVKEATLDEFGVKKHTCTVCGGSYETGDVYRIYGEGRVETALAAAELLKETLGIQKFNAVIIANGDSFADALTGSYLAARKDAPILLYRASGVALNEAYIRDNLSADGIIYILGGTAAVPAEVESSLRDQGYTVVRLAGDSRFDTNLAILEEAGLEGDEILVCTGWEFADSLSASATGMPILMVNSVLDKLTENQIAFLQAHADKNYTVIGGTAAVSDGLLEAIDAQTDGTVSRLYGNSREETSVKVAQRYFDSPAYALVAYSRNFPDGLCGGPLAHAMNAPLLLVNKKAESAAAAYVAEMGIAKGAILGGTAAVSDASGRIVFGLE